MIEDQLRAQPEANLDDVRRQTRLGMGPCQGTFCALRAAGIMHEVYRRNLDDGNAADTHKIDQAADRSSTMLRLFTTNRFDGVFALLYGEQMREAALNQWILQGTLDIDHLPAPSARAKQDTGDLALLHGRPHPPKTSVVSPQPAAVASSANLEGEN